MPERRDSQSSESVAQPDHEPDLYHHDNSLQKGNLRTTQDRKMIKISSLLAVMNLVS